MRKAKWAGMSAVYAVVIVSAFGWIPLLALTAIGGIGLGAWNIKTLRRKNSENPALLEECRENLGEVKRSHKKMGVLLEKIKAENRQGVWSNLNARFIYVEPYFLEYTLAEAADLMGRSLFLAGKAHYMLGGLKKETSNHLAVYKEITDLTTKIEAIKKQTSELFPAIIGEIKMIGRTKELSPDTRKEFIVAVRQFQKLRRTVGVPKTIQQIDRAAIYGKLMEILDILTKIGKGAYTLPKKVGVSGNVIPLKKTS